MDRLGWKTLGIGLIILFILLSLPLTGIVLAGISLDPYLEFVPVSQYIQHAPFSSSVFTAIICLFLAVTIPPIVRICRYQSRTIHNKQASFPWWGWIGIVTGIIAWVLAWSRFAWFEPFQHHTFTPLWLSYIVVINAFTFRRTGKCLLVNRTRYFLILFPVSAGFWWYFEYLNRYVQNWQYKNIESFPPLEYFLFATMCFSTVLPAVLSTYKMFASFPNLYTALSNFKAFRLKHNKTIAWSFLMASMMGLLFLGIYPDFLFPLLWLSPLLILTSLLTILGKRTIISDIQHGDWRRIFLFAISALFCGFFWEMWNFFSLAKWTYSVPFVTRFFVFEMPVAGYLGYLPFGVECAVVGIELGQLLDSGNKLSFDLDIKLC